MRIQISPYEHVHTSSALNTCQKHFILHLSVSRHCTAVPKGKTSLGTNGKA